MIYGSKIRVLVVDDDQAIRDALRLGLEEEGYAVAEAADGAMALDVLRATNERQIVLLDFRMPRVDGGSVLIGVDNDARLAGRDAFILITANLNTVPLPIATLLHRLDVPIISKPFDMDELLDAVAAAAQRLFPTGSQSAPPSLDASR
ncbi:MAG TPA: response regulator [Ktedonobacterales bacterium]|nr:response regulator [Ktedonobacterales bacterium]